MRHLIPRTMLFACVLSTSARLPAQQPEIVHAQLTLKPATATLAGELAKLKAAGTTAWVGYSVPVLHGFQGHWSDQRTAFLEGSGRNGSWTGSDHPGGTAGEVQRGIVLLRVSGGAVNKVQLEPEDEQLDAGGLPFLWLPAVRPEDSIAVLKSLAEAQGSAVRDGAVFLIAEHHSPAAVPALTSLTAPGERPETRERAAFWLANQRGHEGFVAVQKLDHNDPDAGFRKKLAFDLTLSKDPEATAELIRMAKEDTSPEVRTQAQFWLSTRGGQQVAGALLRSAEDDPDRHARGQAVFAVSRLPNGEAEPTLEHLALTSHDSYVRQQAVFWLGQSHDPRALAFLTRLVQATPATTP